MRVRDGETVRIPQFSSDEEAFEWYESHEVTDHFEDTEEVKPDTIIYQDSRGLWYRSSDGVRVPPPKKQIRASRRSTIKQVFIYYAEQILVDDQKIIIREGESATTWTSSLPSYVTTQR